MLTSNTFRAIVCLQVSKYLLTNIQKGVDGMSGEVNITNVRKEDKEFIRIVTGLAPDKMALIKGIVIGLQLQDKQPTQAAQTT